MCEILLKRKNDLPYKSSIKLKKIEREKKANELVSLRKQISEKNKEVEILDRELESIKKSRGYRLLEIYYSLKSKILK